MKRLLPIRGLTLLGKLTRILTVEVFRFVIYASLSLVLLRQEKGLTELIDFVSPFLQSIEAEISEINSYEILEGDREIYQTPHSTTINAVAGRYGLDPAMMATIIQIESKYNPNATSSSGAMGLAQIMPQTWDWLCSDMLDPYNAEQNIECSGRTLKWLSDYYNGDSDKIVPAYNAGPGNLDANNGYPLPGENTLYVQRYKENYPTFAGRTTTHVTKDTYTLDDRWSIYPSGTPYQIIGNQKWHGKARDITAGLGTPILSPIDGALYMRYDGHIGKFGSNNSEIKIIGTDYQVVILHLRFNEDLVNGQMVKRGDLIGAEDSIGNSTDPHAHVQWLDLRNQAYIDPYAVLVK